MKTTILTIFVAAFFMFTAVDSGCAQEASNTNLILVPSQERIPQTEQPRIAPEYIIPPIDNRPSPSAPPPVSANLPLFKAPLVRSLERGKWYVQIGVYTRADHVETAINRAGTASPLVIQNAGTDINPVFRVLLGPFSKNESKTTLQRFKNKGYDAFLRNG